MKGSSPGAESQATGTLLGYVFEVMVTDGDGQGIGNVGRLGKVGEVEFMLDCKLNLALGGPPGAGEDFLDLCGWIVKDGYPGLGRGEANDAPSVAHKDGGSRSGVVGIKLFDRQRFGREGLDHLADPAVKLLKPFAHIASGSATDDASFAQGSTSLRGIQYAIAGDVQTWIDSEDASWDGWHSLEAAG
jgi:hypothetical protein